MRWVSLRSTHPTRSENIFDPRHLDRQRARSTWERELANIADFNAIVDYAELFASFIGDFVDLRGARPRPDFLDPDPDKSYPAGNAFADSVCAAGHYGIVYPSLRHAGGTCLVALVPHVVQSVTQGSVIRLAWSGRPGPRVSEIDSTNPFV